MQVLLLDDLGATIVAIILAAALAGVAVCLAFVALHYWWQTCERFRDWRADLKDRNALAKLYRVNHEWRRIYARQLVEDRWKRRAWVRGFVNSETFARQVRGIAHLDQVIEHAKQVEAKARKPRRLTANDERQAASWLQAVLPAWEEFRDLRDVGAAR